MSLIVQQFLETHSFRELQEQHGVYASFSKSGHKFSLNYDQIEAKEADPLAQECRGLILALLPQNQCGELTLQGVPLAIPNLYLPDGKINMDLVPGKTRVLAFPMKRFFNESQGAAAPIDWNDPQLKIFEKLDGSLIIVYYDWIAQAWYAATRSVPEADLLMDNGIFTFRTLFEKAIKETLNLSWLDFTDKLDKYVTYCFELTTPYNQIVVKYPDCRVTLIAARDVSLGLEIPLDITAFERFPRARTYAFTDIKQVLEWVSAQNPLEHEGVVVMDSQFHRIKVKNANYLALNKIRDTLATSSRNCVELILAEKDDDVMAVLPEAIANNLRNIKKGIQKAIKFYDEAYQELIKQANEVKPGDRKTFALLITQNTYQGYKMWAAPFFHMFDGKSNSMKDFIQSHKKDGTWPDSFLDKILDISNTFNNT
jgi:hypothetical protein